MYLIVCFPLAVTMSGTATSNNDYLSQKMAFLQQLQLENTNALVLKYAFWIVTPSLEAGWWEVNKWGG